MTVWAEQPLDNGSAVWGCDRCSQGGWCSDHTTAWMEARIHADDHQTKADRKVIVLGQPQRGPRIDQARDARIAELRAQQLTLRAIAAIVGLSTNGVRRALARASR